MSSVHILKCHGLSLLDSRVEPGYALNCVRASQGMPTSVQGAKIACLDINLQRYKMQMGVQVRGWIGRGEVIFRKSSGIKKKMVPGVFISFSSWRRSWCLAEKRCVRLLTLLYNS